MSDTEPEKIPDILYHYTSVDAFKSIMTSEKIRATRYDQMNDHGEFQFGVKHLLKSLMDREVERIDEEYKEFLIEGVQSFEEEKLEAFILSLSSVADSLEQWRAYSPNGGVAIGFDSDKVRKGFLIGSPRKVRSTSIESLRTLFPGNQLMRCAYSKSDGVFEWPATLVDKFFKPNSYPAIFRQEPDAIIRELAKSFFRSGIRMEIYRSIATMKHGAYRNEEEWRSVSVNLDAEDYPVQLSEKNRFFIEFPFEASGYIKEVWLSPHGDVDGARNAAEYLKQCFGLSYDIKCSAIPYQT